MNTAAAVIIGAEVLSGKVIDENTPFLIGELRAMGVPLKHISVVLDEIPAIADAVRRASQVATFVVTSGGVGPTHDDVTMEGVAQAFGVPLLRHPELDAMLDRYGRSASDPLRRMALLPDGAELVYSGSFPWPTVLVRNVWILPGIPRLFRQKFAAIRERYQGVPLHCLSVYVQVAESELVPSFERLLAAHPDVAVGSYPRTTDAQAWSVRITLEHTNAARVKAAAAGLLALLSADVVVKIADESSGAEWSLATFIADSLSATSSSVGG